MFQCIPMRNGALTYDHFELCPSSVTDYGRKLRHHCRCKGIVVLIPKSCMKVQYQVLEGLFIREE